MYVFRYQLPYLYIADIEVVNMAAGLLVIASFFQLSDGIQGVGAGIMRGMGDVVVPTAITMVAYWVIGLPLGFWLAFSFGMGARGIWVGLLAGLTVSAILLTSRFLWLSKRFLVQDKRIDIAV